MKWNALTGYMTQMGLQKPAMAAALGLTSEALDALMAGEGMMTPEQEAMMKKCPPGLGAPSQATALSMGDVVSLSAVAVLSGRPGATRDDTLARVGELQTTSVQLLSLTGMPTLTDAIRRVQALSSAIGELVKLSGASDEVTALPLLKKLCGMHAELEAGVKKAKEERVIQMLSVAKAANKITPAEIGGAKGLQAMGILDEDWLVEHLKNRTPITALSAENHDEGSVETGLAVAGTIAGLTEKDGVVALNGLPYEKLGGDVKHNLAQSDAASDKKAFRALRANWQKRGEPVVATA